MNWLSIADWASSKRCQESRHYGSCKCGKKTNPCEVEKAIRRSCEELDMGRTPDMPIEEIAKWVSKQGCHASRNGEYCNHRGCADTETMKSLLHRLIHGERKAA